MKFLWWPFDSSLDEESIYYSALLGAMESIEYGVTTIFDHHASMNFVEGSLNLIKKACNKVGIKALLCFEVSERQGIKEVKKHVNENLIFINENKNSKNIKGIFGLHANFTLSDQTLKYIRDNKPQSVPIHIHCGEDIADLEFCIKQGYKGPVDRLDCFNLLSLNSLLVHSIHLSKTDFRILTKKRPIIISAPESNAKNNVGKINISKIKDHTLGTDGMSYDMIATLKSQFLLQGGIDSINLKNIFFENKKKLLEKFFPDTGSFQIGKKADIAVLDYIPITPIKLSNLPEHLIFGAKNSRAFITIINGKILYFKGEFTNLNKEEILDKANQVSHKLHKRYYYEQIKY